MKSKRLKAFTLLEMLIVMLLSTLVLAVAYLALQLVNMQYVNFDRNTEKIMTVSRLRTQLAKDLARADVVRHQGDCLVLEKHIAPAHRGLIEYCFEDSLLLRRQEQLTDTFHLTPAAIAFSWEGRAQSEGPIDHVSFTGGLNGEVYPFLFRKTYDARTKWQLTNQLQDQ